MSLPDSMDRLAGSDLPDGTIELWARVVGRVDAAVTLARAGSSVRRMTVAELARLPHVGRKRAARAFAAIELGRRLMSQPLRRGHAIKCAQDVVDAYRTRLLDLERECFCAVYLDIRNRVICGELVSVGSLAKCGVYPADVLRTAIRVAAPRLIVLHTHPSSGDPTPSAEDDGVTASLGHLASAFGIELVDHVIIGDQSHFSYAEAGRLPK